MALVKVLLPVGEVEAGGAKLAPRLRSLEGKRIGFIDNEMWRSMHILVDDLAKVFTAEYGATGTETVFLGPAAEVNPKGYQAALGELAGKVDAVVSGLGN